MNIDDRVKERYVIGGLILLLLFTISIDVWTAVRVPDILIQELNPIYIMSGNLYILIFINIITLAYLSYTLIKKVSLAKIYIIIIMTIFMMFGHMFGAYSNLEASKQYTTEPEAFVEKYSGENAPSDTSKMGKYFLITFYIILLPIGLSILSFVLAHKIYVWRQPKRDKMVDEMCKLARKLED